MKDITRKDARLERTEFLAKIGMLIGHRYSQIALEPGSRPFR